jgi:ABC-2 type transport system permease protein
MLSDTWLLIRLRWLLTWNTFRGRRWYTQLLTAVGLTALAALIGGFSGAVGLGAGAILDRFPQLKLEPLMPGLILSAVMALLLLNSFGVALGSLFLSNDLDLLMAAPVNRRAVFISKVLDGMSSYFLLALTAAGPALAAYGLGLGYGPLYYLLALAAVLAAPLLPAGLGALIIMLVARFAPARRVREIMGLAAALIGVSCSLISNTARFWVRGSLARPDLGVLLERVRQFVDLPFPPFVAGRALAAAGAGDWLGSLAGLSGFLALSLGGFAACVWLADSLYATGWMRMQSSGVANRGRERAAARSGGLLAAAAPPVALALKDWRVIPRDLRNFAQFLAPLFILPVLYLNFFSGFRTGASPIQQAGALARGLVNVNAIGMAATILFAVELVFNRIASSGISMEGRAYWLLKTAPIRGWELLLGKYLTAVAPFAALSTVLFLGLAVWRGFSPAGALYGLFGILLLGAGELAVETGLSVPWANLEWDDPRRMQSGFGNLAAFFACNLMGLLAGSALCVPLLLRVLLPAYEWIGWLVGPVVAVAVTAGVGGALFSLGLSRLSRVGEA